jgi:hypothetical protein
MMMKNTIALLFLCATYSVIYAQVPAAKSDSVIHRGMAIEVSGGYSVALGTYASSDRQNKKSGYATNGWQVQVTFDWLGKKDFGLALSYAYQRNPAKEAANQVFPNGIPDSLGSGSWSNHYLMIGPVFMKNIGNFQVDGKISGGVMVSSSPVFDTPDPTDSTGGKYNKNIATGFSYQVSAGFGYRVSSHLAVKLNVNLMGGWPGANRQYSSQLIRYETYKDPVTGVEYTKPVYSAPVEYDIKKVVTTLNPTIGLVYRF